jgi:hypothetical protein
MVSKDGRQTEVTTLDHGEPSRQSVGSRTGNNPKQGSFAKNNPSEERVRKQQPQTGVIRLQGKMERTVINHNQSN